MKEKWSSLSYFIVSLFILCCSTCIWADTNFTGAHKRTLDNIIERINAEEKHNDIYVKEIAHLKKSADQALERLSRGNIEKQEVDKAHFAYSVAVSNVLSIQQSLDDADQELKELEHELKRSRLRNQELQLKTKTPEIERNINRLSTTIEFLNLLISHYTTLHRILKDNVEESREISELKHKFYIDLLNEYNEQQNELRENYIASLNKHNQREQSTWLKKLHALTLKLDDSSLTQSERIRLKLEIDQAEEEVAISSLMLKLMKYHDHIEDINAKLVNTTTVQSIDSETHSLSNLKSELSYFDKKLRTKFDIMQTRDEIQKNYFKEGLINEKQYQDNKVLIDALTKKYNKLQKTVNDHYTRLAQLSELASHKMAEAISKRQSLPGANMDDWRKLSNSLLMIPSQSLDLLTSLYRHVLLNYEVNNWSITFFSSLLPFFLLFLTLVLKHYLDLFLIALSSSRQRVTSNFIYVILQIIRRNLYSLFFVMSTLLMLYWMEVPFVYYRFLYQLSLVWFSYSSVSLFSRLCLVETTSDVAGDDVRLFKRLNRTLIVGGLLTALAVLAKLLNVQYETQDLISRFLMLFMFAVAAVLLKSSNLLPKLFSQVIDIKRQYLLRVFSLLAFLIPLNILIISVVGMIGYVQLAWRMSYYQMIFIFVLTVYLVTRGIINDFMEFLSETIIRYSRNGWLLSEAILKPLDRIVHLVIFAASVGLLFVLYGWNHESIVVMSITDLIHYPFVNFKGGQISVLSLFEFGLMLCIVIWATKWSHEFGYRMLFAEIKDPGLRKSLAVFFQYAVGICGIMPTIWILGIDFTGLSMILSALAIGIGFGLRDFANNIVSGILLLIERPVKEGDLVTIGGSEGRVTYIGLRSMIVRTFDHMDVMVPNSEAFNKSFSNWTYHDSIVRTIIKIKIHRSDDPIYVQSLIYDVLANIEEVLTEPEPQILFKEMDDTLIEFETRYFMDINKHSRIVTRSKVLFVIWQRFKACGIKAPYPQQDIMLLNDFTATNKPLT